MTLAADRPVLTGTFDSLNPRYCGWLSTTV